MEKEDFQAFVLMINILLYPLRTIEHLAVKFQDPLQMTPLLLLNHQNQRIVP